jgi:hypothetical protein
MTPDGTFNPDAVRAFGETMERIRKAFTEVLAVGMNSGCDIELPNPFSPGDFFEVELNAANPQGFVIRKLDDPHLEWAREYVRALFKLVDIDPKEELVKLRDAGCTFGGAPVLSIVPKE